MERPSLAPWSWLTHCTHWPKGNEVPADSLGRIASSRGGQLALKLQLAISWTRRLPWKDDSSMTTTVTRKNRVTIPAEGGRKLGIKPGWKLDWRPVRRQTER